MQYVSEINKNIINLILTCNVKPWLFIKTYRRLKSIKKTIKFFNGKNCDKKELKKILYQVRKNNIRTINISDNNYPKILKNISNPPPLLFYKGDKIMDSDFNIAIVGSRNCSSYGIKAAKYFAKELSRLNIAVVSGMARGIDFNAQMEAIKNKGGSIGVLGCGIGHVYPKSSEKLYKSITLNGSLVSEYPPFRRPRKWHFPYRNRIISGLSKGVLVIESAKKGGALITANLALKQNREVFAVPGDIFSKTSTGCNNLIKNGAKLVGSLEDLLEEFYYLCKNSNN